MSESEARLRTEYMPGEEGNLVQAEKCLSRLARRAFRRPLRENEMAKYMGIVESELAAGENFGAAVKAGMLAILCSKSFSSWRKITGPESRVFERLGTGVPAFLFFLEHNAGRGTLFSRGEGDPVGRRRSDAAGGPDVKGFQGQEVCGFLFLAVASSEEGGDVPRTKSCIPIMTLIWRRA